MDIQQTMNNPQGENKARKVLLFYSITSHYLNFLNISINPQFYFYRYKTVKKQNNKKETQENNFNQKENISMGIKKH